MIFLQLAGGLVLLILGGDILVRGAVATAERLHLSPLLIGLTVVAMGGSMPELVTTVEAALIGSPGIAIGNVIGSNIANSLLILGCAALLVPLSVNLDNLRRDGGVMVALTLLVAALIAYDHIARLTGLLLVASLVAYIAWAYFSDANANRQEQEENPVSPQGFPVLSVLLIIGGLALTILGARLLVLGAIDLARILEVSETMIGLSIIAVGTSLPELATSVIAALKRQGDLVIGNVIGSNIYNIAGILGITAIISPIDIPDSLSPIDITFFVASCFIILIFVTTGRRLSRTEGTLLLCGYIAFIAILATHS